MSRSVQLGAVVGSVFLRRTEFREVYVLLSLVGLVAGVAVLMRLRPSDRVIRRAFVGSSIVYFAAAAAAGLIDFRALQSLSAEDGPIEWVTAHALLIAWLLAATALLRGVWRGRPGHMAAFLASGLCLAWGRELAWGRPFIGKRIWYSRNLFRPQAYIAPAYFEAFKESEGLAEDPALLYAAHLVLSGLLVVVSVALAIYLFRHRRRFLRDVRDLPRRTYGRYFLMGLGAYGAAQVIGTLARNLLECRALAAWHRAHGVLGHRVVDEPIELWAAACFLMSAILLCRGTSRPADVAGPGRENPETRA